MAKGLVIAATGVGKTYLAAFDSLGHQQILFLAHREEILRQAEMSYKYVRPGARTGFFTGAAKDENADIYFATVQSLAREQNLKHFPKDFFSYIIVDEFHRTAADSYLNVLGYFRPQFLLGLTATPYRMDNRDIFALCDDNVIYEIYLKDAINRDLLAPFRYYGIYDDTDYSQVEYRSGKYVVDDLERQLSREELIDMDKFPAAARKQLKGLYVQLGEEHMNKFALNGDRVVYTGKGSFLSEQEKDKVETFLEEGKIYQVKTTLVNDSRSYVQLKEFPDEIFGLTHFDGIAQR